MPVPREAPFHDLAIIGAGAAGLATAIFGARRNPSLAVAALDGTRKLGAKILVSGGGRCNVTNDVVTPGDYQGGSSNIVRRVLNAFTVEQTVAFFRELGVRLHVEPGGKLFPDTNSARTVLEALLAEAKRCGVKLLTDQRVTWIERRADRFEISVPSGTLSASRVILATGGKSLPKTGSDGTGYTFAQHLGHALVPPVPALAPLVLEGDFHAPLAGISQEVELAVRVEGHKPVRWRGPLLWTHFGVSGPVAMNAAGTWHRARLENRPATVLVNFLPGADFATAENRLVALAASRPKLALHNGLEAWVPARVALAVLDKLGISWQIPLAHLTREDRRKLVHSLLNWPLPVRDSRGYNYAEVTAGGVPLDEIDPATMESRKCPGLYLVGEILDVDGRIGGFNFQWAWSSAWVAAAGVANA
jgi:hypothetical protein